MLPPNAAGKVPEPPSADWYDLRGRVFHFLGTHAGWACWKNSDENEPGTWVCGPEKDRDRALARDTRVAAAQHDPRLIPSRSIPEHHAFADVTEAGWNRLLMGVFTYLDGPARLDDVATIAGVVLKLPGVSLLPTGAAGVGMAVPLQESGDSMAPTA